VSKSWIIVAVLGSALAAGVCLAQTEKPEPEINSCEDAIREAEAFLRDQVGDEVYDQGFQFVSCNFKEPPHKPRYSLDYSFSPIPGEALVLEFGVLVWPQGSCYATGQPLPKCAENQDFCTVNYSREDAIELAAQADLKGLPSEWKVALRTHRETEYLVWEVATEWKKGKSMGSREVVYINAFSGNWAGPLTENFINLE